MSKFIIHKPEVEGNKAIFKYSVKTAEKDFDFQEEHIFTFDLENDISMKNLCIAASISYYKLHLAQTIYVDWSLNEQEKEFWQWIFRNGFSELIYKNQLDWSVIDNLVFESPNPTSEELLSNLRFDKNLEESSVVGIGGGKDSSVVVELLKKITIPVIGYSTEVKPTKIIEENVDSLEIEFCPIVRNVDEQLKTLKEGVYLGHIPVSLVYAFTGILIAYQKNKKYIFVGNEASADEENNFWLDRPVNHQWSKSFEFEKIVNSFVKENIHKDLTYVSILRPFASLKIVEFFAKNCEYVFKYFSSCNNNFKIQTQNTNNVWCGECPKCLGTYILLGEYLNKNQLKEIFGQNLEENIALEKLFKELLGLLPEKPFDCVATRSEMCFAFEQINEEMRNGKLFSGLTEKELEKIKTEAKVGKEYKNAIHENILPKEILEKLLKVI